jgi:hypothetical protein
VNIQADQDIRDLAQKYFDALYFGDVDLFRSIFHPRAQLFCTAHGDDVYMDVEKYLAIVAGRPSPSSRGDRREEEILSISVGSSTTALLRVRELFIPKRFTDDLALLLVNGEWKIISKSWHYETELN